MSSRPSTDKPRTILAAALVDSLIPDGPNCKVVLCHFGSGQTDFVMDLQRYAKRTGRPILTVNCLPSETETPFGTLSSLIDNIPATTDFLAVMRELDRALSAVRGQGEEPALLLMENAHYMDPESAYILAQIVQSRIADLLLLTDEDIGQVENLEPFQSLNVSVTLELGLLNEEEVAAELRRITAAPPTTGSINEIMSLTGGIYELVMLVCAQIESRRMWQRIAGYSVLCTEQLLQNDWTDTAVQLVFEQLSDADAIAIKQIALAGTCDISFTHRWLSSDGSWAFSAGLLRRTQEGEIALASTLLEDMIIRKMPPSEAGELLANPSYADLRFAGKGWRRALWSLLAGGEATDHELAEAACAANDAGQYREAYELATAPSNEPISVLRRTEELRAMAKTGQDIDAMADLVHFSSLEVSDAEAESLSTFWITILPRYIEKSDVLQQAVTALERIQEQTSGDTRTAVNQRLLLVRFVQSGRNGSVSPEDIEAFLSDSQPVEVVFSALMFGLEHLILEIDDPIARAAVVRLGNEGTFGHKLRAYASVLLAQEVQGKDIAETRILQKSLHAYWPQGMLLNALESTARAWQAEHAGRHEQCLADLIQATADFKAGGALDSAQHTAVAVLVRDPEAEDLVIRELARSAASSLPEASPLFRALSALEEIALPTDGERKLEDVIERLVDSALPEVAIQGFWHLYRFHSAEARRIVADNGAVVRKLAEHTDSERYRVIAEVLMCLGSSPHAVANLIDQGDGKVPAEAKDVVWAEVLRACSDDSALAAEARRHLYRKGRKFDTLPVVADVLEQHGLSARELDISKWAARGLSNKHIAMELNLSVRTVEGHLYRAFAKLGLRDRTGLNALELA